MSPKKKPNADLERNKRTFFLIGLIFSLALIYAGFELYALNEKQNDLKPEIDDSIIIDEKDTPDAFVKPEPQKRQIIATYVLKIIDDNKPVDTNIPYIDDSEYNPDDFIVPIQTIEDPTTTTPPLTFSEKMPKFPGEDGAFNQYLSENLKYPEVCINLRIEGTVLVEFVVEKDGSLTQIKVKNSVYPDLDEEAIRVLKNSPKWIPGENLGKKVRVSYTLPIKFHLQ
ncbi:MAG: energy transducer TonB [Bacteroidetes bacterium]|nr:energy transducer TonB [Bacteroidota bacterium]